MIDLKFLKAFMLIRQVDQNSALFATTAVFWI